MNTKRAMLLGSAALVVSAAGALLVYLGRLAAARRLRQDVKHLLAETVGGTPRIYHEAQLVGLPAPVKRYFRQVLRDGQPYLRGLRLRHSGKFKTDLKKDWVSIEGEEYLTARPAGFIWQGTTSQFTARDEYVDGHGALSVRLLGAVPVLHGEGPAYDQGELLRWLGECAWLPTALLPGAEVAWVDVDDESARLLCAQHGQSVSCLVRFNQQNEMEECEALRHLGNGPLQPWIGRFSHYRYWQGVRVPTVVEASWVVDGRRQPYAQFAVQELEFDPQEPY